MGDVTDGQLPKTVEDLERDLARLRALHFGIAYSQTSVGKVQECRDRVRDLTEQIDELRAEIRRRKGL